MHGATARAETAAEELVGRVVVLQAGAAAARVDVAAEPRCMLAHVSVEGLVLTSQLSQPGHRLCQARLC